LLLAHIATYKPVDAFDCITVSFQVLRICNLIALLWLYLLPCSRDRSDIDAEHQPLIADQNTTVYEAMGAAHNPASTERDDEEHERPKNTGIAADVGDWWEYVKEFKVSTYYLDVLEDPLTQLAVIHRFSYHTSGQMKSFSNSKLSFLDFIHLHQMP
jgi:hypothetical protein